MKTRNPVAKHAPKFNRSKVEKPKKGKGSYTRGKKACYNIIEQGGF